MILLSDIDLRMRALCAALVRLCFFTPAFQGHSARSLLQSFISDSFSYNLNTKDSRELHSIMARPSSGTARASSLLNTAVQLVTVASLASVAWSAPADNTIEVVGDSGVR